MFLNCKLIGNEPPRPRSFLIKDVREIEPTTGVNEYIILVTNPDRSNRIYVTIEPAERKRLGISI